YHFDPYGIDLRTMPTTENASLKLGQLIGNDLPNALSSDVSGYDISGLGGNDTISIGQDIGYGISDADGGDGDDVIGGSTGFLSGGGGNDTINGSADGSIDGGSGNDVLTGSNNMFGGDGNDLLQAGGEGGTTATLGGGNGNDTLIGYFSDDLLLGDAGDDSLVGGAGNDTLDGGTGADVMKGGDGNDTAD